MAEERVKNIYAALRALGVKNLGRVVIVERAGRSVVYIDGERFGIYDHEKKTFVD